MTGYTIIIDVVLNRRRRMPPPPSPSRQSQSHPTPASSHPVPVAGIRLLPLLRERRLRPISRLGPTTTRRMTTSGCESCARGPNPPPPAYRTTLTSAASSAKFNVCSLNFCSSSMSRRNVEYSSSEDSFSHWQKTTMWTVSNPLVKDSVMRMRMKRRALLPMTPGAR